MGDGFQFLDIILLRSSQDFSSYGCVAYWADETDIGLARRTPSRRIRSLNNLMKRLCVCRIERTAH